MGVRLSTVHDAIAAVLDSRRDLLPAVEAEIARWNRVQQLLADLGDAVTTARELGGDASPLGAGPDVSALEQTAAEASAALAATRARVSRHTVNIGVSGRARNGKSTLLQSLSGLDDDQIPTGRGQPVTAVRSRIFHSDTVRTAQLTLHTDRSFCAEVVAPYFRVLGLSPEPRTAADLERFDLRAAIAALPPAVLDPNRPMVARLQELHESLPGYRPLLTGEVRSVDITELRRWVAYPARSADGVPDRRHLAVRDAVITCRFPDSDVESLGLVDLPGLGELVPDAEAHHLAGLENDVDFVIVVKRPTDNTSMWAAEDQRSLDLIARACGAAAVRDFMTILVNTGECPPVNVDALDADIRDRLNDGTADRNYQVWHADVADRADVATGVLRRTLEHLAEALPRMDAAVIDGALARCRAAAGELTTQLDELLAAVGSVTRPTPMEEVIERADTVRDELVVSVQKWVTGLRDRTGETYEDDDFVERVELLTEEIRGWAVDGFGLGRDVWIERALLGMMKESAAAGFSAQALNGIRNELAHRFGHIDDVLDQRRDQFWEGLTDALRPRLDGLLVGKTAREQLTYLVAALRDAPDPCPHLARTVELALDVRLDYRTRLLPRMRRRLELLRPETVDRRTGMIRTPPVAPHTAEGAAQLHTEILELARQAIYEAGAMLQEEPSMMATVLYAYGEQFEDMFIRSEGSVPEFRRLVSVYRDELWPEERSGPATATAAVQRVVGLLRTLRTTLVGEVAA